MEVYFKDFKEEAQKKILEFYGLKTPQEANFDVFPMFVLTKPEEE